MRGLVKWLVWKLPEHGLDGTGKARMVSAGGDSARYPEGDKFRTHRIFGHRVTNFTACPGDALFGQLPKLRRKVIRRITDTGGGVGEGGRRSDATRELCPPHLAAGSQVFAGPWRMRSKRPAAIEAVTVT